MENRSTTIYDYREWETCGIIRRKAIRVDDFFVSLVPHGQPGSFCLPSERVALTYAEAREAVRARARIRLGKAERQVARLRRVLSVSPSNPERIP